MHTQSCILHSTFKYNLLMINLGGYLVKQGQVFWQGDACLAFFPELQILDGHAIIANLSNAHQYSKWSADEVKQAAKMSAAINASFIQFFQAESTTLHIQVVDDKIWKKTLIHLIPRKKDDLSENDELYRMLSAYPRQLLSMNAEKEVVLANIERVCKLSQQFQHFRAKFI